MIDKEWLNSKVEKNCSQSQIAKEAGVSASTVNYWLRTYGLKIKGRYGGYVKVDIEDAVKLSFSWAEVCRRLGRPEGGRPQSYLKQKATEWGLDYSHFPGLYGGKRPTRFPAPMGEYLVEGKLLYSKFKKILIREGVLTDECSKCGLVTWDGEVGICELDHVNSDPYDNRVDNLQMLCPNCHRVKTRRDAREARRPKVTPKSKPKERPRKVVRPSSGELLELIWTKPTLVIARDFEVSDVAVAKWAKAYGIPKPPRGYWMRDLDTRTQIRYSMLGDRAC